MRKVLVGLICSLLLGCASMEPVKEVASKKEVFAACKTVDVLTTAHILNAGGVEVNPVMKWIMGGGTALGPLIIVSAAIVAAVWWVDTPEVTMAANAVTCPVAGHNIWQIVK